MKFSEKEKNDLLKSLAAISLAFAIVFRTGNDLVSTIIFFAIAALTAGVGFLAHELAHKYVAQKYGCWAEYRSFDNMLILMLGLSFLGVIIAAPGAVMIMGHVGKARNGRISAAGPLSSLALAIVFGSAFIAAQFLAITLPFLATFLKFGLIINSLIAFFNLLPIWNFDGKKVLAWSKRNYALMMGAAFILLVFSFSV